MEYSRNKREIIGTYRSLKQLKLIYIYELILNVHWQMLLECSRINNGKCMLDTSCFRNFKHFYNLR